MLLTPTAESSRELERQVSEPRTHPPYPGETFAVSVTHAQLSNLRGILASAIYPVNSSILGGVNNRIKVIKRPGKPR